MSEALGPGPRTRVRRLPEKAAYDEPTVFAILDEALLCHVAATVDGLALALPTLHARVGRTVYLHGSRANALLRAVLDAGVAALSVTIYDGLRLARSAFESSIAYRSVVVVGATREVSEPEEKRAALRAVLDAALAGRGEEVRPATAREENLTLVVALSIDEASAKVSAGPTQETPADAALPVWAGTVRARVVFDAVVANTDGAMATGAVAVPASVRRRVEAT